MPSYQEPSSGANPCQSLELLPAKFDARYEDDSVSCSMRFSDGDRVEFDRSVKIGETA